MNRRIEKYFSEAISNLKVEEVKSEFQRSYLLIFLFSSILILIIVNFFFLHESVITFYGGISSFVTLLAFVLFFLIYQVLVLQYLKQKLRCGAGTTNAYKFIHTTIEISFPTVIIFHMMLEREVISFIDSPISLMYFLFIILSILHLDFKVNIFAGTLAALQYIFLVYYGFNILDNATSPLLTPETAHYLRAITLVFAGAAAAFVSAELKSRIKTTFDFQEKKNELEVLFGQHVSKEVSKAVIEEKGMIRRREATIMFLDVRNFSGFADTHSAEEVIEYQNKFLSPIMDIIIQHQGVVFQILGDGLMASFGSPGENVLHADMAFQAGLEILKQVKRASDEKVIPATTIGIGLHSGQVVTGNIGNENRKQFSISGNPVIIAARIEQLNKKYGTQFLISDQVYQRIEKGSMQISFLAQEPLRGIGIPVEVYKVA